MNLLFKKSEFLVIYLNNIIKKQRSTKNENSLGDWAR